VDARLRLIWKLSAENEGGYLLPSAGENLPFWRIEADVILPALENLPAALKQFGAFFPVGLGTDTDNIGFHKNRNRQ
jgi:hypothetical protein